MEIDVIAGVFGIRILSDEETPEHCKMPDSCINGTFIVQLESGEWGELCSAWAPYEGEEVTIESDGKRIIGIVKDVNEYIED